MGHALSERLVAGIAAQDQAAITSCFTDEAQLRALLPHGVRERSGAEEVGSLIATWFGDSTMLDLDEARATEVGDRLHIGYRFTGVEEGERYVVEQHLVCTVRDDKIEHAHLLCSGFRPRQPQ